MNHSRRKLLAFTAASAVLGPAFGARAETAMRVPQVDTLRVTVVTDSSYDTPRVEANRWVKVKRSGVYSRDDFRKALHNEWGLSLAVESTREGDSRRFLLDYGYTPAALMNNLAILGIDPARLDALVLSHGHYDHFGGLVEFLRQNRERLPATLDLYVGGEDNFCIRKTQAGTPGHFSDWGVLDRRELEALRVNVISCERSTVIRDHAFTTGAIPRQSFEKVFPNTMVEYGRRDGLGCDLPAEKEKAQGKPVPDTHLHEHATCFNIKDRGLVVISSCGHAGIVNSVLRAREVSGVSKVHAVLGGFHLFPADDAYLRQVVGELRKLAPDVMIPLHCSGPGIVRVLRELMPAELVTSTNGSEFLLGA